MTNNAIHHRLLMRMSEPAIEPVTLDDAKLYLRIDHVLEDALISSLIVAARVAAENWTRRSFITQSWKLGYDNYLPPAIGLPMGPINAVTGINIIHSDSSVLTVDNTAYHLNSAKNVLILDSCITGFHIEIIYTAGYGNNISNVPAPIRQGMLAHIAAMYENRGDLAGTARMPEQAISLYMPFREVSL